MEGEEVSGGDVMGMGLGDGDVSADVMEKGSLSPLTGSYLLIVLAEPHSEEDREIILQRLNKGLLSWNVDTSHVDLNCELLNLANSGPEGDEARNGEKLVQWASENLVVEVLIHSQVNTLQQCMKNLLASFTRHRHIIHAGYTFQGSGSWVLQDGTFSLSDYLELWGEAEVQRILSAYKGDISVSMHCASENGWTQERFDKEPFAKLCQTTMNPPDKMSTAHNSGIGTFIEYISKMLIPTPLKEILEPSDIVGNIRFSHPTLYVFPGGQGDAALFGINGFNMLIDGGFSRKSCFWDFTRHLDRLDAVLLTRVNNNSVGGLSSVIQRKVMNQVYPQIGHFFGNVLERRGPPGGGGGGGEKHEKESGGGEGDEQHEKLLVSLNDEGQKMVENLRNISLKPHLCFRETTIEPINLYHKVGHGKLDLYVLNPARDSREVKDFLSKWNSDCKSFVSSRISSRHDGKDFQFPVLNLVSICALLVWQPANPRDPITRILFPGSTPQYKIFEALQKLKHLEFLKYPVCTGKTIAASNKSKVKSEKIISEAKQQLSKVGSHGEGGLNQQQPSSTDGSLSRTALTKTATSSSSTFSHRSSSRTKAAMAAATSSSKEDVQPPTKERVSSRRLVSKSSAGPDSNKIPLKSDSPIHIKKQIKSTIASSKVSSSSATGLGSGKTSSSTKIPPKGPLKSGSGKIGKETSTTTTTTTTASMTPSTGAKKASPTSPAKSKIGLKGKTGVGLTKASTISSDTPPQTPPKSAKDANNRRVIETKTKLKSNVKTETQKQTAHSKVEDIKRRATSKVSSIPKSVPSKSPTHTPSGVAVKRITSAKKPIKDTKEKVVGKALSTATNLPDDIEEEEKKIKVETNGSIIRDEVAKSDEMDGDQETETELEPDSQPSSLPPAFLPTESGSELSSLDHISVHEQDGATVSEDLSLSVISKDQFESETLQGDGVAESEQDEEEEEYLIVEKDESTTDNVESEKILAKTVGSLDESCPTTPQIPTEAETDSFIPASELLEELEKEIIPGDGDGEGDGEETTEEVQADAESEKESLTEISPAPQQQEDGGADESSAAVSDPAAAAPSEKTDEENVLEKLETEIPSDPEKGQDEEKVDVAAGEKDEECDQVEVEAVAEAATTAADESEDVDVESKEEAEGEDEKEGKVSEEKEVEEGGGEGEGEDMTSMKNVPETDSSRLELKDDVEPSESQSEKVTEEVGPPGEDEEEAGESSQKLSELSSSKNEEDVHEASHPASLLAEGGEGEEGDADTDKTATTLPAGESSEQQTIEEKVGEGEGEGGESGEKDKVEGETAAPSEELPGNNEASSEQDKVEKDEGVAAGGEKEDLEKLEEETPEGKKDLPDDIDETTQDKLPGHGKTAAETTVAESSEPELQQPEQLEETTTSTSTGAQEEGEEEGQVQEAESSSASQQKESGAQVEDAGAGTGAGAGSEEDAKVEVEVEVDEPAVTATVVEPETKLPAELEINDNDETVSKLKEEQLPDLSTLEKSIEQELQEQQDTETTTTTAETAQNLNQQDEINEDKTKQLTGTDQEQEEPKDQTQVDPESIKEDTTATSSTPPQVPLESEAGTETETGTGAELEEDNKDTDERRANQVIETVNLGTEDAIEKTEASASGTEEPEPQKDELEKGESHISSESEKGAANEEEKVEKIETEIEAISQDPAIPIDESKEGKADEEKIDEICKEEEILKNKLDISQNKVDEDQKEKEDEIKSESVPTTQTETEETESIQGADEKLESEESKESVQEEKLDTLLAESEPSAQADDAEVTKETETEKDSDIPVVESSETEAHKEEEIIETQEPLTLSQDSKSKSEEVTSEEKSEITEKEVAAEDTSDSIIIPQEISTDTTPEKVTQKLDDSGKTGSTQDDALETGDKQELDISEAPATAVKLDSQKEIIDDAKEEDISQDTATTLETAEKSEITPKEDSPVEGEVAESSEIPQDASQLAEEEQQEIISEETCQKTDAVETAPQSLAEEIEIATELEVAEKKAEDDTLQSQADEGKTKEEAEKKSEQKVEEKAEEKVEVKADLEASETVAEKSESETTGTADEKTESAAAAVDEKSVTEDAHTEEAITTDKDEDKSQVHEKSAETEATEISSAQQSTTVETTETEVTKTDVKPEATEVADEKPEATEVTGEKSDTIDVPDEKPEITEEKSKETEVADETSGAVELKAAEKPEAEVEPEAVVKSEAVEKKEISDTAEKQVAVEKVEETTESVIDSKDEETIAEVPVTEASPKNSDEGESKEDTKSDEKPDSSKTIDNTEPEVSEKQTDDKQDAPEKEDDTAQAVEAESIEQVTTTQISEKLEASEAAVESEKPDDKQEPPSKVSDISDESKEADSTKEVTNKPEAKIETSGVQDDSKIESVEKESDEKADVAPEVDEKSGATDKAEEKSSVVAGEKPVETDVEAAQEPDATAEATPTAKEEVTEKVDESSEKIEKTDDTQETLGASQDDEGKAEEMSTEIKTAATEGEDSKDSPVDEPADEEQKQTEAVQVEKLETVGKSDEKSQVEKDEDKPETSLKIDDKSETSQKSDEKSDEIDKAAGEKPAETDKVSETPEVSEMAKDGKSDEAEEEAEKDQVEEPEKIDEQTESLVIAEETPSSKTSEKDETAGKVEGAQVETTATGTKSPEPVDKEQASGSVDEKLESSSSVVGVEAEESDSKVTESTGTTEESKEIELKDLDKSDVEKEADQLESADDKKESEIIEKSLEKSEKEEASETKQDTTTTKMTSEVQEETIVKEIAPTDDTSEKVEKASEKESIGENLDNSSQAGDKSQIPQETTATDGKSEEQIDTLVNWEITVGAQDTAQKDDDDDTVKLVPASKEAENLTGDKDDTHVKGETAQASEKIQIKSSDEEAQEKAGEAKADEKSSSQQSETSASSPQIKDDKPSKGGSIGDTAEETGKESERKSSVTPPQEGEQDEEEKESTKAGEKADDLLFHDSETDKKMDKDSVVAVKTGDKPAQLVASIAKSEETELVMEEKSEEKQDTAPEKADKQDYVPSPSSSSSTDKKEKESSADENLKEETSITSTAEGAAVEETTAKSSPKIPEISDKSATDTIITGIVKSEEMCTEKVDATSEKAELSRATVEEEDDDNDNQAGDCEEKQDNDTEKSKEEKTDLIQAETASVVSAETTGSLPKEPQAEKTKEEIPAVSPTSDNKLKGEKSETLEPPEKVKSPEPEPEPDSAVLEPPDIGTAKQQPSKAVPSSDIMSEKSNDLQHANLGTTLIETESDPEPKVESTPEKPSEKVELQTEEAESGPEAAPSKDQPETEKGALAQEDNAKQGETATEAEVQSASKPEADTDQSDLKNVQSPTKSTGTGAAPDLESELISAEEEKDGGEDEKEETEDKVRSTLYVEDDEDEGVVEGATKRVVDKDDPKFIRPLPYQETITSEEGIDTLLKEGKVLAEAQAAEINKIKEQDEKIAVGIPSAIPSKLPRVSREVIRTPDEVADLPVHEEVEPGTYETDPAADPESLSIEEDPGVEAIAIAKLPSSKSPSPSPTPALRPIVGDLPPSSPSLQDPNQEQDQDHVTKVDVHPATIILPTETEIVAAVVTKIDAAVSPVLESLLGQSPPKTFPPTPSTPSPSPDPSPAPTPAESAAPVAVAEKKSDDKSSPPPSPSTDSKISKDKDHQIQTQSTDIQKIESPVELEKDSQLKEKEEILVVEHEKEEAVSQEVKVTDKTEEADVVNMTDKNLQDENKIGDVKSDEETKGAGDDDDKNETKDIKMIDITVAPEEEEKVGASASELAAKPITSVVITPSTPPVSIAGKSEFNYSQDKQSGPSSPQTAQTTETKEEDEEVVVPSVESAEDEGKDVQVETSGASALSSSEIHETESPKLDQNEMDENVKVVESSTATSTSTITLLTDERERQLSNSDESSPSSPTPLTAVVSEEVATGKVSDEQQQQQGAEAEEKITEQLNKSEKITASHVPSSAASATEAPDDVDTGDVKVKTGVKKVGAEKLFLLPGKKEDDEDDKSDVDDEDIYETDEPVLGAIRAGLLTAATTLSAAVISQSPEDLASIPTMYESEEHRAAKSGEASAKSPKSPAEPERTQEKLSKDEEADLTGRSSSPETKTLHQLSHLQQEQQQQDDSTTTTTASEIKTVETDTIAPETITTTTAEQLESGFNDAEKIQSSSISILESETTDRHEKEIIIGGDSVSSTTTTTTTTITTKLIDDDIPSKTDQPATPINTTIDSDEKEIITRADSGSASAVVGSILVECGTNIVQEKTSMEIEEAGEQVQVEGEAAVAAPSTSTEELANKLVSTQLEQEQVDTTPATADQEQDGKDDTSRPSISKIETEAGKVVVSENEKSITSPQSSEPPSDIKDKEEEVESCIAASASGASTEINQSSSKDESALASDSSNIQSTPEIPSTPAAPISHEAEVASPSPSTDDLQTKLDSGVHNIDIVGSSSSVDVSAKVISVNDRPPAALAVDRTETVAEEKDSIQEQESLVILSVDETSTSLLESASASASDKVIGDLATELIESLNNAEKVVSSVLQAVESQVEAKIKLAEQVLEEVEGKLESAATGVSSPLAEQEKQIEDDSGRESIIAGAGAGESQDISVSPVQQEGSASVGKSIVIDDANVMGALSEGDGNGNLAEQRDAEEEEEEIVDVEMVDVEGEATEQLIVLDPTEGDSSGKSIGAPLTSTRTNSHRSSVSSDVDVGSASEHLASSQSQFQSVAKEKDCGGGGGEEEVANLDHIMDVGPDLDSSTTITTTTTTTPSQLDLGQETSVPSQFGEKSSSPTVTRTEAQSDIEKPLEISSTSPISLTSISSTTTTAKEITSESKTTTEIPLDSTHVSATSDMTILKSSLQDSTSSLDLTESISTMVQSSEGLSSTSAIASTSSFISSSTEREIEERTTSSTSSKGPLLSSMGGSDSAYSGGGSLSLTEIEEIINVTSSSEGAGKVESVPGSMHSPRGDEDASATSADPNILSSIKDFVEISDAKETTTTTETTFPSSSIESEIIESGGEKSGDLNSELSAIKVSTEEKSSSIISQEINYKVSSSVVESGAGEVNVTDSQAKESVVSHGEEIKMEGDSKVVHQVESSASAASTLTSSSSSSTVASQSQSQSTSAGATVEKKSDSISVSVRDGGLESKIQSSTTSGSEIQIGEVTSSPSALSPKTESVERKKDEGEETPKSSGGSGSRRVSESLCGDLSKAEGGETSHSSMYTVETSAQLINLAEEKEKSNIEQASQTHKTHTISSTSLHSSSSSSSSSTTATAASAPTHTDTDAGTGIVMEKEDVTTSESGASRLQFSTEESSTKIGEEKKKDEISKSTSYSSSSEVTETLAPSTSSTSATTSSTSSTSKTVQDSSSSLASEKTSTSTSQFVHAKSDVLESQSVAGSSSSSSSSSGGSVSGVTAKPTVGDSVIKSSTTGGKTSSSSSSSSTSASSGTSKSVITRRFSSQEVCRDLEKKESAGFVSGRRRASEIIEHSEEIIPAGSSSSSTASPVVVVETGGAEEAVGEAGTSTSTGTSSSTTTDYVKVDKEKEMSRTSPGGSFYGGYGYVFGSAADDDAEENPTDEESIYGEDSQSHSLSTRDSNQSIMLSSDTLPMASSSTTTTTTTVVDKTDSGSGTITTTTTTTVLTHSSSPQPIQLEEKLLSLEKETRTTLGEKVEKGSSYFPVSHDLGDEGSYSSGDFSDSQLSMIAGGKDDDGDSYRLEKKVVVSQDAENGNTPSGTSTTSNSRTVQESSSSSSSGASGLSAVVLSAGTGGSPIKITTISSKSSTSTTIHTVTDPKTGKTTRTEVTKESGSSGSGPEAAAGSSFSSEFEFSSTAAPSSSSRQKEAEGDDILKSWGKPLGLPPVQSEDPPAPSSTNPSVEPVEQAPAGLAKGTPKKDKSVDRKNPGTPAKSSGAGHSTSSRGRSHHRSSKNTNPIYVDLAYVPHHGNSNYCDSEFFRLVRSRYYVFSGLEPSREVFDGLLQGKQQWEDKNLEVTIIPTYDTDTLGYWVVDSEDALAEARIDLAPSASRCTINLQDHETSCSAYRLEF